MNLFDQIQELDFPAPLPPTLLEIEQLFEAPKVDDVATTAALAVQESGVLANMRPGASVAIGVGSRGIANLPTIVQSVVAQFQAAGLHPFITPAMGSHAGATSESQTEMLANLGVTEASVGAPIRATMEVRQIGQMDEGPPLFQDLLSAGADHTFLIARIKPHTSFRSDIESGLAKMLVIGLGKQQGAAVMHARGVYGLIHYIGPAARVYAAQTNIVGGLAIVENGYDQTAEIHCLPACDIGNQREAELLVKAKSLMPSLPFPHIDVLVVRELGKNISGTGMDTNVIGRMKIPRQAEPTDGVDIATIAVLDLTETTHGNAYGMGLANVITARVARQIDWKAVYTNALTSGVLGMWRTSMPMTMADDRRAIQAALRGCGEEQENARLVFLRDTLTLDRLWVSPSLRSQVEAHPRLKIVDETPLAFGDHGAMCSPWKMKG